MSRAALLEGLSGLFVGDGPATGYCGLLLSHLGLEPSYIGLGPSAARGSNDRARRRAVQVAYFARHGSVHDVSSAPCDVVSAIEDLGPRADVVVIDADWLARMGIASIREPDQAPVVWVSSLAPRATGRVGTDLEASAAGGASWAIGDPEREPLSLPNELASYQLGLNAAAVALAMLLQPGSAEGQRTAECVGSEVLAWYTDMNSIARGYGIAYHRERTRAAGSAGVYPYGIFDCADGRVSLIARSGKEWRSMLESLGDPEWSRDERYRDPVLVADRYADEVDALLTTELTRFTRAELGTLSRRFGYALAPVNSIDDVLEEPHFRERGFFTNIDVAGLGLLKLPGSPYRVRPSDRRPRSSEDDSVTPRPVAGGDRSDNDRPLRGVRVLDLTWVWAGPLAASVLGELGGDVIKIEHRDRPDKHRLAALIDSDGRRRTSLEHSPFYIDVNRGKRCVALDLTQERGRKLLLDLVRESDVLLENMRAGALDNLGLDPETLHSVNPELVVVSMPSAGRDGPLRDLRAYAPVMSSITGLDSLVGYPGEEALGMMTVGLGDPNSAIHAVVAALAGLLARERGRAGSFIELSQIEALLALLAEPVADAQLSLGSKSVLGNRHPAMAPRGIFATEGRDGWVSISVADDTQWRRLARLMAVTARYRPEDIADQCGRLLRDTDLDSVDGRLARSGELEDVITRWAALFPRDQLVELLREHGVPAAPVMSPDELVADGSYAFQGRSRWMIQQPGLGRQPAHRVPWRTTALPDVQPAQAPFFGQHTLQVLREVLLMSDDELSELVLAGVLR